MSKRGMYKWARKQLRDEPEPFPLWLRVLIIGGIALFIGLKLLGVI